MSAYAAADCCCCCCCLQSHEKLEFGVLQLESQKKSLQRQKDRLQEVSLLLWFAFQL
jgi:hypothetical protein